MICPENVEEAKSQAERVVNQALHRDGHLVWSTPITASEVAVRFALTTRMKERAAALRRESRHTRAVRSMPDVVNGRQMSSFLRDGGLLCGEYQVEKCTKSEEECGAMHRCGVLLRTPLLHDPEKGKITPKTKNSMGGGRDLYPLGQPPMKVTPPRQQAVTSAPIFHAELHVRNAPTSAAMTPGLCPRRLHIAASTKISPLPHGWW